MIGLLYYHKYNTSVPIYNCVLVKSYHTMIRSLILWTSQLNIRS